jgi:Ca2+-binding RTX toxin-like protein
MKFRRVAGFVAIGLVILVVTNMIAAMADTNTVPQLQMEDQSQPVKANDVKPPECAALDLANIVSGSGTITGTPGNDLILGSPADDVIDGMGGDDCILGRGGADTLDGNDGVDVCIAGPGNSTFLNCESTFP